MHNRDWIEHKVETGQWVHISDGYLYSIKTGVTTVREGVVYCRKDGGSRPSYIFVYDHDRFGYVNCAAEPGVIHNDAVWLMWPYEKKAIDIFTKREEERIKELEKEINRRKRKIKFFSIVEEM